MAEAERVANREHEVADSHSLGVADRHVGQSTGLDLDDGNIGSGIRADYLCIKHFAVDRRNLDLVRLVHHVVVGEDIAVFRVDDYARPGAGNLAFPAARHVGQAKKAPKCLIAKMPARGYRLADADIDDSRGHRFHEWSEAR